MSKVEMIPLSAPRINGNAWKYVKDCLDTQWVSSVGRYVGDFERAVCGFTGAKHAVAAVNGTAALHVALKLAGLGPGDAAVVPALTFIATANAVAYTGASCLFADCEPRRFNVDLDRLEERLSRRGRGPKPKVFLATHILGRPLDMDRVQAIAKRFGLTVVEDAAESIGSYWRGRHTGTFGRLGALSFNGNKIVTTGGGGMILTDDAAMARRAKHLTQQAKLDGREYVHDEVGYNYRLTNVAAALGLAQMESLPAFLKKRERIAAWYREFLPGVPIEPDLPGARWNRWLFAVEVGSARERDALIERLEGSGCQARPLWRPVPLQPAYLSSQVDCPGALRAYETTVNIPSSTSLTQAQAERVAKILRKARIRRLLA